MRKGRLSSLLGNFFQADFDPSLLCVPIEIMDARPIVLSTRKPVISASTLRSASAGALISISAVISISFLLEPMSLIDPFGAPVIEMVPPGEKSNLSDRVSTRLSRSWPLADPTAINPTQSKESRIFFIDLTRSGLEYIVLGGCNKLQPITGG